MCLRCQPACDEMGQKTAKFGQKLAFLAKYQIAFLQGLAGSFGALLVGWLVVMARGCISQDTYLLYLVIKQRFPS